MTLQNAFKDLATEQAVTNLTSAIDALASLLQRQGSMSPQRTLQYARTANDQMRVNVDNTPAVTVASGAITATIASGPVTVASANRTDADYTGAGVQVPMWSRYSWNIVEPRQQLAEAQQSNFIMSRNRWVFS